MQKFQDQMTAIDKELATLKNFSEGEPVATADREFHKSYNNEPIAQQVTTLQTKKLDLQSKIDALLDEARKKGVEPGQLR
jgi:glycerol-3-phosphate dehydrogenase